MEQDPSDALEALVTADASRAFDDPELACVYYTERVNLPAGDEVTLRSTVEAPGCV